MNAHTRPVSKAPRGTTAHELEESQVAQVLFQEHKNLKLEALKMKKKALTFKAELVVSGTALYSASRWNTNRPAGASPQ